MFWTFPAASAKAQIVSQPFKRSQLGLFQGKTKQYGNNVPHSKHKTRRTWLPNVQRKRLFSEALNEHVRVKVTTRALKTIKKHNGIDNYVHNMPSKTLGWEGMRIRLMVKSASKNPRSPAGASKEETDAWIAKRAEELRIQSATEARRVEITRIIRDDLPDLTTARKATEQALKALGPSAR
ncbi:hypothetical protein DFH05DRAFT_1533705 [Lentinula detonsa]|uniref:Large ribosomal subunit protein bL28c n=2 Tax=Lentinula TaxID=5352 RepID=A0AA38L5Y2_9AGAR|nr:hypothetical protein DFH05DRAFT_1533705 [Lentinula detonsa]KAJ3786205.1 hypothetical protein GGU10DRAFT_267655 [Lentinula aff. detonsa]KAJ3798767.1 hypothetical protein GGU11DRAFT_680913 [Lentinula aff. detonsa]